MYERISHERSCNYGKHLLINYLTKKTENLNASPKLTFVEAVKACFKKYATFKGRARRSEYWWFALFTYIVNGIFYIPFMLISSVHSAAVAKFSSELTLASLDQYDSLMNQATALDAQYQSYYIIVGVIYGIVWLAMLLPTLGVLVRRLHDIGKSGKIILLCLIPLVNFVIAILLFVWALKDSDPKENQYGPSPKYSAEA